MGRYEEVEGKLEDSTFDCVMKRITGILLR